MTQSNLAWPKAHGDSLFTAIFKQYPEDFIVEEVLPYELSGSGEFEFVWIEKSHLTTEQAAAAIARFCDLPKRAVSWAGMKDKFSISRQWLSVHLPGKASPNWLLLKNDGLKVLTSQRHLKKLRVGNHSLNRFIIRLRNVNTDKGEVEKKLEMLRDYGYPNYFGEQRFGRDGGTLIAAKDWLAQGEESLPNYKRGLYMSAFRSFLFNKILAQRVLAKNWNNAIEGDRLELRGSHSHFSYDGQAATDARVAEGDVSPVASLYGRGTNLISDEALVIERDQRETELEIMACLERRTEISYRAMRALPTELVWRWEGDDLLLNFALPPGSFATAMLAELCEYPAPHSLA